MCGKNGWKSEDLPQRRRQRLAVSVNERQDARLYRRDSLSESGGPLTEDPGHVR